MNSAKISGALTVVFLKMAAPLAKKDRIFNAAVESALDHLCIPHLASKVGFKLEKGGDWKQSVRDWAHAVPVPERGKALALIRANIRNRFDLFVYKRT